MKRIRNLVLLAGLLGSLPSIHAQIAALDGGSLAVSPASSPVLAALARTEALTPVTASDVPLGATVWLATGTAQGGVQLVPLPVLPAAARAGQMPIYQIGPAGSGQYLLDGIQSPVDAALATASVLSLMDRVQNPAATMATTAMTSTQMRTLGAALPAPGGGGVGIKGLDTGGGVIGYALDTNRLWLEISKVVKGTAYMNLRHASNQVYAIETTTNLLTPFIVEAEIWPTNAASQPFTLLTSNRPTLFVRAQDWTGVDSDGDGVPNWWLWYYFHTLDLSASDCDSLGWTLLADYQAGLDPNVVGFTLSTPNAYVNAAGAAPLQVNLQGGIPGAYALLVDDTNRAHANWTAYVTSNLVAGLGTVAGWHSVTVGLRGFPTNAIATWQTVRFKLDLTPPRLALTNPVPGSVTRPVLQIQGWATENLSRLTYDLTNAAGAVTGQQVIVMKRDYDTNTLECTTNYFQCFDVPLTNGVNTLTFHATDLAGNTTSTNFTYTLTAPANPPGLQLLWPQAGAKISGNDFTARGKVNDPTARITAQIVNANGSIQTLTGRVGRDGDFLVDGLPLSSGTNILTLTATDWAGHNSTLTLPVRQSELVLKITSASLGGAVTGTISDTNYTVWVNGVKATNNLDGTWTAPNPNLTLDTPSVQVQAMANADPTGTNATSVETTLAWPDGTTYRNVVRFHQYQYTMGVDWTPSDAITTFTEDWAETAGGTAEEKCDYLNYFPYGSPYDCKFFWAPGRGPDGGIGYEIVLPGGTTNGAGPANTTASPAWYGSTSFTSSNGNAVIQISGQQEVALLTGGDATAAATELYALTGCATEYTYTDPFLPNAIPTSIPPEQIQMGSLGHLATDASGAAVLYVALPTHSQVSITPNASGTGWKWANASAQPCPIIWQCVATTPANQKRTDLGVGEQVSLGVVLPTATTNIVWSTTAGGLSRLIGTNLTVFTAPSNAASATVTVTVEGKSESIKFNVFEPTNFVYAIITSTNHYAVGTAGAGMVNDVYIGLTNVSFHRVWMEEVGAVSTNATGYFADPSLCSTNALDHGKNGANKWLRLDEQNAWTDTAATSGSPPPWSNGSFSWPIPVAWQVGGFSTPKTNYITGWDQQFIIDASGTVTIKKFRHTVTRTINDIITTQ